MLPSESDSHKIGEKVSTSVQAYVSSSYYLVLPSPRKRHPCISYRKKICLKQTLCAPIRLKSQAQCSGVANIPSITILSEDTQNVLYFPCILLRLRRMLAVVLEEGVCGRSVLLVHPWLKAQLTYTSFRRDLETHFSWK